MPGEDFTPNPGADENTQQPDLTGVNIGISASDYATQQFKGVYEGIHKDFDDKLSIVRATMAPNSEAVDQERSAEIAQLKKLYAAKHSSMIAGEHDQKEYNKKLAALNMSYKADEFSVTAKYDKMLREQNREYDKQKMQLDIQKQSTLDAADKQHLHQIGQMNAYDELAKDGLITQQEVERRKFKLFGVNLPEPKTSQQELDQLFKQYNEVDQRLKSYMDIPAKSTYFGFGSDTTPKLQARYLDESGTMQNRDVTDPRELTMVRNLKVLRGNLQAQVANKSAEVISGLQSYADAAQRAPGGPKSLTATKIKTTGMETNMKRGPSQTVIQKQQDTLKPYTTKEREEKAQYYYNLAGKNKDMARQLLATDEARRGK